MFINKCISGIRRGYPGKLRWPKLLKYKFKLKAKKSKGMGMGALWGITSKWGQGLSCNSYAFSIDEIPFWFRVILLSLVQRGRHTKIFFMNVHPPPKKGGKCSYILCFIFRDPPMPAVSENNWLIVIRRPKRHILGWHSLLSFICLILFCLTNTYIALTICQALFKLLHK